nr:MULTISPECIES: GAF domain-containing protein [Myxococcaceae]
MVDDNPANLLALEAVLEPLGARLHKVESGEEALRALLKEDYAVILLDVQMAGLSGFETAQLIKGREKTRHVPIIFLTAYGRDDAQVVAGYAQGAVDFLQKPYVPEILRSKVGVFVELYRAREQVRRQALALREQERRAAQEAELATQHVARLKSVSAALSGALTPEQVAEVVMEQGRRALGAILASVVRFTPDGRELEIVGTLGIDAPTQDFYRRFSVDTPVPIADAARTGEPVLLETPEERERRYPHIPRTQDITLTGAWASLPLWVEGRPLGALGFVFAEPRRFSALELDLMQSLGQQCAQAFERGRLYAAERHAREEAQAAEARMKLLAEASQAVSEAELDLRSVLQTLARQASEQLACRTMVSVLSANGRRLDLVANHSPDPTDAALLAQLMRAHPPAMGEGLAGVVAQTGRPVLIPRVDTAQLQASMKRELTPYAERYPVHSLIVLPLFRQGRLVGVMHAMRGQESAVPFDAEDLSFLQALASRAALAVENARLFSELRTNASQLELALDTAALGTWHFDVHANQLTWDARCKAMFGFAPDVPVDYEMFLSRLHPEDRARVHRDYERAFDPAGGGEYACEFRVVLPAAGQVRWLRALGRCLFEAGRPVRFVGTQQDITRQKQEEAEQRARSEFEQQLLGIVGHDLRNPLSAILMSAAVLRTRVTDERALKPVGRIIQSAERATRITHDLLDLTQARLGGGIPVHRRPVDVHELARTVVEEHQASHPARELRFRSEGDGGGRFDGDRLAQVVANLLGNALAYSPADTPVSVSTRGEADAVVLEVHNTGEPIPDDVRPDLFEPFKRGAPSQESNPRKSLGLGLFIVERIVSAHGGRIDCTSDSADGTRFTVRLPRA